MFGDKNDRAVFVLALAEACQKEWWQVHAFCFKWNHFHHESRLQMGSWNNVPKLMARIT